MTEAVKEGGREWQGRVLQLRLLVFIGAVTLELEWKWGAEGVGGGGGLLC